MKFLAFATLFALTVFVSVEANKYISCHTTSGGIGGALYTHDEDVVVVRYSEKLRKGFIVCEDCDDQKVTRRVAFGGNDYSTLLDLDTDEKCTPIECVLDDTRKAVHHEAPSCPQCNCSCDEPECNCNCPESSCECTPTACPDSTCTNECSPCECGDVTCGVTECSAVCDDCNCGDVTCSEADCAFACPECPDCAGDATIECQCPECSQEQECSCPSVPVPELKLCSREPVAASNTDDVVIFASAEEGICVHNTKSEEASVQVFFLDQDNATQTATITVGANSKTCQSTDSPVSGVCTGVVNRQTIQYV